MKWHGPDTHAVYPQKQAKHDWNAVWILLVLVGTTAALVVLAR